MKGKSVSEKGLLILKNQIFQHRIWIMEQLEVLEKEKYAFDKPNGHTIMMYSVLYYQSWELTSV